MDGAASDLCGSTPLFDAASNGRFNAVDLLVGVPWAVGHRPRDAGQAIMRCVDLTGRGVLHAAIVEEATADVEDSTRDAIVRRLLQAGADVHCADEDGKNMCHLLGNHSCRWKTAAI